MQAPHRSIVHCVRYRGRYEGYLRRNQICVGKGHDGKSRACRNGVKHLLPGLWHVMPTESVQHAVRTASSAAG